MILSITLFQLINVILVFVLLFLGFKLLETNWSYKISKPFAWEEAVAKGEISTELKKTERFYRDKVRFYTFWFQIERLKHGNIKGSFAEVGVYKGETAKMIHAMDPSRKFHLFDTFEGFAKKDLALEKFDKESNGVDFSDTSLELVTQFINGKENIVLHKGYFPETTKGLAEERYAFVHLDADLYQPTMEGLKYFYPRLEIGGVIIVHDYNHNWEGVKKAVDEFMATSSENLVPIADWQGSVVITRSGKA